MKRHHDSLDNSISRLRSRALLLDASTVQFLANHTIFHALTGSYFGDRNTSAILHSLLSKHAQSGEVNKDEESDIYALNHVLSFLEQWMLADEVVLDRDALDSLAHQNVGFVRPRFEQLSELFRIEVLSNSLKQEAANNVVRFFELMTDHNNPLFGFRAAHGIDDLDFPLKDDYYSKLHGTLGVSGNVPERALYYLELSHLFGTPLLLHPEKARF